MKSTCAIYAMFLLLVAVGCSEADETSDFMVKNPDLYNQQLARGRSLQQAWTTTPLQIMRHLLGPENSEDASPFAYRQVVHVDSSITATVTQEGLQDDSVYGERTVVTFVRVRGVWAVKQVKVGFKCREGRGHSDYYSGTWCD